jgi:hypothetical protein
MPNYDNAILSYELRPAQFSMNAAGTQITAKLPLYAVRDTATPAPKPAIESGAFWHMNSGDYQRDTYQTFSPLWRLDFSSQSGSYDTYQTLTSIVWGYAVVSEATQAARVTAERGKVWQSDFTSFATLPIRTRASFPTPPESVSFTFPTPTEPSWVWLGFKLPGAPGGPDNKWQDPNAWYANGVEGPAVNGVPVAPATFQVGLNAWLFDGDFRTWYSPSASISASPTFARNGGTSALTITVPDSLRTLTASDLVVTGGTISNFTKVS